MTNMEDQRVIELEERIRRLENYILKAKITALAILATFGAVTLFFGSLFMIVNPDKSIWLVIFGLPSLIVGLYYALKWKHKLAP